jgi:hypothetical protein
MEKKEAFNIIRGCVGCNLTNIEFGLDTNYFLLLSFKYFLFLFIVYVFSQNFITVAFFFVVVIVVVVLRLF